MRRFLNIFLAMIPAAIVFLLIGFHPFDGLDNMLCDRIYSQMNGTDDTIKLITIDEETLAEYGTLSSWSRDKSADLIQYLYADSENAPAVLAFDLMFIGDTNPETDKKLADAASQVDHLVLASNLVMRGKTKYTENNERYYDYMNIESEEIPYDSLNQVAKTGFTNVNISTDGYVRTALLTANVDSTNLAADSSSAGIATDSASSDSSTRNSFAYQIYQEYLLASGLLSAGNSTLAKATSRYRNLTLTNFFYSGKPAEMTHYSMVDVLNGKIPTAAFADSIVIVGVYAPGLQDSYHSAASRSQDMYGVEINANIVNALLTGKVASVVNRWLVAAILALVIFLYTYAARAMKMYPALIVGVWVLLADGIIARLLATHGHLISLIYLLMVVLLIMGWVIIEKYVFEIIKKKRMLGTFRKYMAPQVIDNLAKDENFHIELGGEERNVAVLFVDIRGFTSMSEVLTPKEVVQILNQYLSLTTECIFEQEGMLDKFVGDATMAVFNAPNDQEDYIYKAVLAGLSMVKKSATLSEKLLKEHGRTVSFGIGVHYGDAVVGNVGCDTRMDYTAIGDTVNTAARIESKAQKGELLVSEAVYKALEGRIVAEFKEAMSLKGKAEPVPVYRVTDVVSS